MNNESNHVRQQKIIPALILALGIVGGGFLLGKQVEDGIKFFRSFDRIVEVKGLAEKNVRSDLATWNITFSVNGEDLKNLYQQISEHQKITIEFLTQNGFKEEDTQLGTISVTDNWANQYGSNNEKLPHYQITTSISVTTNNVDLINKVSQHAGELVDKGIIVTNNNINYFYNSLNSIKAQMLDEATKNARSAAMTFAKNTQSHLGK